MSSETLTEQPPRAAGGLTAGQFFLLLSMLGATAAVILSPNTHPAALLLLSAAVISAGLVAMAAHRALDAFLGRRGTLAGPSERSRRLLEQDKALVLRSIKELEFDRAMGKVSDADFQEIGARLRARALTLMQQLDSISRGGAEMVSRGGAETRRKARATCDACGTSNDSDARFCKQCGAPL
jgi:hypothetical protein